MSAHRDKKVSFKKVKKSNNSGKAGCGCLFFLLIVLMIFIGLSVHPFTLKIIGKQFRYEDKIVKSDVIYVPRFEEDKHGEIYIEAFREYWAGSGRAIWIEEDKILGLSLYDIITQMARARGIKENIIFKIEGQGDNIQKINKIKGIIEKSNVKKIILIVPEYASRRYHILFNSKKDDRVIFIVKPAQVSYFKMERWWKDSVSRELLLKEAVSLWSIYFHKFKFGDLVKERVKKDE